MTEQTQAERLAEYLTGLAGEIDHTHYTDDVRLSAAELYRLSAVNAELLAALKACLDWMETLRISGDAGNWEWKEDEYTAGWQAIARAEDK
jgi:hypothetical protein